MIEAVLQVGVNLPAMHGKTGSHKGKPSLLAVPGGRDIVT